VPSHFDTGQETERLTAWTGGTILTPFNGAGVVGDSGVVDSDSVLHLLVHAFEAMTEGVVIYGDDGRIVYMNAAACRILELVGASDGVPVASAVDGAWWLNTSDEQRRLFHLAECVLHPLLHGKAPTRSRAKDLRITTSTGRDVLLSRYVRPLRDAEGRTVANVAVIRVISRQEQLERASASRVRQLRAAIDAITDAVIIFDSAERIVQLNPGARELLELEEASDGFYFPVCASLPLTVLREEADPSWSEALAPASRILRGEILTGDLALDALLHTRRWGDLPLTITGAPMRDAGGRCIGGVMVLRDAIERRLQKQRMHEAATQQEEPRPNDEFIALGMHELRNVTASLCGYVEMLSTDATSGKQAKLTKWQIETIEEVAHEAACLADLTDQIADVMGLHAGRFEMHCYGADLVALVRRIAKRLQVTTQRHDIVVTTTAASIIAEMDVRRIEQVLTNLIGNAIKYSPDGSDILVQVREDHSSGRAFVAVHDHGIGIPVDQHGRVFQRFGRADNARELGVEGTGLGLFLCREIVERHGGRIWFRSNAGSGTIFYISLRVVAGAHGTHTRK
jgi:signal transduction histidine kinase